MGTSDPVFQKRIKEHGLDVAKREDAPKIGELWIDQVWHGKAFTWEKIPKWVLCVPYGHLLYRRMLDRGRERRNGMERVLDWLMGLGVTPC